MCIARAKIAQLETEGIIAALTKAGRHLAETIALTDS